MNILVIDGQGGNIGRRLVELIGEKFPDVKITAVGTNSMATSNMMKGGSVTAATGENAVIVGCRRADIIAGPMGIVVADALCGEVTPKMAVAIAQSRALRVLVPMSKCETLVAGIGTQSVTSLLDDAMEKISAAISNNT